MTFLQKAISIQPSERFTALIALDDPWLKDTEQVSCQASKPQEDALRSSGAPLDHTTDKAKAVREHQTVLQKSDDKSSYQDSGFEKDSTIWGPKNSLLQINDQTSDIIELTSSQDHRTTESK
jgi:hypothetical protein